MVRSPIAGSVAATRPPSRPQTRARSAPTAIHPRLPGLHQGLLGASGSFVLEFGVGMAGYQQRAERIGDVAQWGRGGRRRRPAWNAWTRSSGSTKRAYQVGGRQVVRRTCPPQRTRDCRPAVILELNSDVGTDMPVRPVG
jgi:hypothetical protein